MDSASDSTNALPANDQELIALAEQSFQARYSRSPRWIVAAPGRVNLIGEHIDYNDGFVLPMAIERYVLLAADESETTQTEVQLHSTALEKDVSFALSEQTPTNPPQWSDYIRGVFAGCNQRGMTTGGLDITIDSTVPLGGGLSSSAALEVATATLIESVTGNPFENPVDKALLCQKAEHDFAGVPCGIMDQFSVTLCQADHLMLLDCRSQQIEMVPCHDESVTVLIINSNVKHELTGGEYAQRRQQCEEAAQQLGVSSLRELCPQDVEEKRESLGPVHYARARHVTTEIERTRSAAAAFSASDWATLGQLMYQSHASLRDDYEVSCQELDLLVQLAQDLGSSGGVIGSRMTGGGFGGCTVSLVRTDQVAATAKTICGRYLQETGIEPSYFTTRPAAGARVLRQP